MTVARRPGRRVASAPLFVLAIAGAELGIDASTEAMRWRGVWHMLACAHDT